MTFSQAFMTQTKQTRKIKIVILSLIVFLSCLSLVIISILSTDIENKDNYVAYEEPSYEEPTNSEEILETEEKHDKKVLPSWDATTYESILESRKASTDNIQVTVFNNITGEIMHDGQLVVNLVNRTDHTLWDLNGQVNLCNLLQSMALIGTIPAPVPTSANEEDGYKGGEGGAIHLTHQPLLNMTLDCVGLHKQETYGEGNWILAVYATRLAAAAARVDFQFQCYDGRNSQMSRLLPWLETYQPAPSESNIWPYKGQLPTYEEVCSNEPENVRVYYMIDEIMNDMQKMGVTLIGSREGKTHPDIPINQAPLIPNVDVEDVVIHFRCGDILGGSDIHLFYGIIQFSEYHKWISKDARTIGIVTQPFEKKLNRQMDRSNVDKCRKATYLLVSSLQEFLPSAKISIHNGVNDTLPLTYARLIMADQSFTTKSTFGTFPVFGGFGEGYFQRSLESLNKVSEIYPEKLFVMDGNYKTSAQLTNMTLESILEWLGGKRVRRS